MVASQTTLPSTVMTPCILTARRAPVEDGDFDAELVAGDDGAAEAGVFDAGEDHELVVAVGDLGEQERAAGLGDGFDDEDAGHDGVVGEVAGELRLVDGDVFDGDDALSCAPSR